MKKRDPMNYQLATVSKALEILDLLNSAQGHLSLTQIADAIDLPKSSVFRYLATLERYDYIERDKETDRYHLGLKVLQLGATVERRQHPRNVAHPIMWKLRETFGETVNLAVPRHGKVVYLEVLESPSAVKMISHVGDEDFAHSSALGKAMLAMMPEGKLKAMEKWPLVQCTPYTITDWPTLYIELETIRQRGFAIDERESNLDVRCVGAAIRDNRAEVVASISISGPESRMTTARVLEIGPELVKATSHISALLGYEQAKHQNV
jgi:IclR family transcriptional regulator, KDG regulon repressor